MLKTHIGLFALMKLVEAGDSYAYARAKLDERYFFGDMETALFAVVKDHVDHYGTLPALQTILDMGFPKVETPDLADYYLDQVTARYQFKALGMLSKDIAGKLKENDGEGAKKLVSQQMLEITESEIRQQMFEFKADAASVFGQHFHTKNGGLIKALNLGFPTLDSLNGGLISGDVVSYVGRPATGKTWQLLYSALHMWGEQNADVLFVSMEMPPVALINRLVALYSGIPMNHIKDAKLSSPELEHLGMSFKKLNDHPGSLWILDGNLTSTVPQVFTMAAHLKPEAVFIDGAYMLAHDNKALNRYVRVAENVEMIKKLTHLAGIPTICTWQFNKDAARKAKKKDGQDKVGLEDIGYSDAIGQISTIVLGLFEGDAEGEDVHTLHHRKVDIMKGRNGEMGEFKINWDFVNMNFSEVATTQEMEAM